MMALLLTGCSNEAAAPMDDATGFVLSLGTPSVEVTTRSTPSELGTPLPQDFRLRIQNDYSHAFVYDGRYKPFVSAGNGDYTIVATYGEDLPIALDMPYYYGSAQASIAGKGDKPQVSIHCSIANALASVHYYDGEGQPGTAGFDAVFSSYGVQVWRGDQYVTMQHGASAYFRVGETPRFVFVGTPKDGGPQVSYAIAQDKFPATVEAARHLILKLSMQKTPDGITIYDDEEADDSTPFDGFDPCL